MRFLLCGRRLWPRSATQQLLEACQPSRRTMTDPELQERAEREAAGARAAAAASRRQPSLPFEVALGPGPPPRRNHRGRVSRRPWR